jgi:hypothetical protein
MTEDETINILSFPEFCRCKGIIPNRAAGKAYSAWIENNLRGDESDLVEVRKNLESQQRGGRQQAVVRLTRGNRWPSRS